MKKGFVALFIALVCASAVLADASAQISKGRVTLGENVQVSIVSGVKGVYKNVAVYLGKRQVASIGVNDPVSKLAKERFSPGPSYVVSYTPKQPGSYSFKVYDYDARKYIVLPLVVVDVSYAHKNICSKVKTFAVRGKACSQELCASKGLEFEGCLKDRTYSRAVCRQVTKTECGGACPADFGLSGIEKCG